MAMEILGFEAGRLLVQHRGGISLRSNKLYRAIFDYHALNKCGWLFLVIEGVVDLAVYQD
jgi:hypothetical protein